MTVDRERFGQHIVLISSLDGGGCLLGFNKDQWPNQWIRLLGHQLSVESLGIDSAEPTPRTWVWA